MTRKPDNAVVWTEMPVRDLDAAITFYNSVFRSGLTVDTSGPNPIATFPAADGGVAGHLYAGKPPAKGSGPTVHFAVPDTLEAAMERCKKAGGEVRDMIIPLPMGRFAYGFDPDGNSIGLFQPS